MTGGVTRYEILEPFGASLLGRYFKARDRELERLVLLWILPPDLFQDGGERRRCLRLAAAVSALQHPGLLALYETGETEDGGLFQAFAWAEGEMLARRLEAGPLKPAVAIDLTAQVAAGLALAHSRGILHGHLDPSSLLITSSGEAKLVDLSAASLGERTWDGAGGARVAAWLAPERRQGLAADVRSDVWGLGAMLYEMVTGVRPRDGRQEPLRSLRPDVSEDLERIVERALSPMPGDRPASAGDLRRELAALARSGSHPVATAPASQHQPSGGRIGHYRLLEALGGGGMGVVHRAEDTRLGRTVALKLLAPELARDPVAKARFFQEARTASALEHPNLCTIHDAGEADDGRLWLAMPCYDGETLRSRLGRGPLPIDEAVEVARQVALGLAKAHRQGIVHRDVKPANLMLTSDGVVKILDFGIAKLAGEAGLTRTGVAIGTPGYMSPEQALGRDVDHRTDLWALGVVLYEMLAGRRPFPGEHGAAVVEGILHREPEPLAKQRPEIPPALQEIVGRLLAKDPGGRSASADEAARDLRSLLGPPSASLSAMQPSAAWPAQRSWAVGSLLVLLVAGGVAGWRLLPSTPSLESPKFQRITDQEGIELYPSLSPDGSFFVYAKESGGDLDIFLQRVGGSEPINLTADSPVDDTQPAFSPDGASIAFRSERAGGGLFLMGATGESVRRLTDFGFQPAWSPDGREIAFAREGVDSPAGRDSESRIWRLDVATGRRWLVTHGDGVQPSWSPHGRRIAYWGIPSGTGRRVLWTIPTGGGKPAPVIDDGWLNWNPVWSPDGRFLYFVSDRSGSMNVWRVGIDEATGEVQGEPEPVTIPAPWSGLLSFSKDGKRLVYSARETRSNIVRVALDPARPSIVGAPVPVTRGSMLISFSKISPDGRWIAFNTWEEQEDLFLLRPDGSGLRRLTDDPYRDRVPLWSPDGRLVFLSNRSGRYEAWAIRPDGGGLEQLTETQGRARHPVISPDGRLLAFGLTPRGAALMDLRAPLPGRHLQRLPDAPGDGAFSPDAWSRDGLRLAGVGTAGLLVYSFETGRYERLASGFAPVWMSDDRRLLYIDPQNRICVVGSRLGEGRILLRPAKGAKFLGVDVSPDDRALFVIQIQESGDIWALTLNGKGS